MVEAHPGVAEEGARDRARRVRTSAHFDAAGQQEGVRRTSRPRESHSCRSTRRRSPSSARSAIRRREKCVGKLYSAELARRAFARPLSTRGRRGARPVRGRLPPRSRDSPRRSRRSRSFSRHPSRRSPQSSPSHSCFAANPAMIAIRRVLDGVVMSLVAAVLLAMVLLSALQILLRNVLDTGLLWIDPLLRHFVLFLALLGGIVGHGEQTAHSDQRPRAYACTGRRCRSSARASRRSRRSICAGHRSRLAPADS